MILSSPDNIRYTSKWTRGCLEVFRDTKPIGKAQIPSSNEAKKIFNMVAITEAPLLDIIVFNDISKDMVGLNILEMSYSSDRESILYQGKFLVKAPQK